jgi:NAD(P)H-hydrate repair Nnr-like enzyme with NAD(P)H-hydrate dehydratase domain
VPQGIDPKGDKDTLARDLSRKLGNVTVMQKGAVDVISNGDDVLKCDEQGGLKRCGGQGDILSGQIGTMLAWSKLYEEGVGRCVFSRHHCWHILSRDTGRTTRCRQSDCRCWLRTAPPS